MTKNKLGNHTELAKDSWLDSKDEPRIVHQLLIGLRYHIQTQYLLSSRKSRQRIVVWIAVAATVLTVIFAVTR